ncbi:MAG: hypothetical protein KF810_14430 [Rhizobiaceae bacterium]|nr:hypothetical protein [Rhizobiaceae bacterium]
MVQSVTGDEAQGSASPPDPEAIRAHLKTLLSSPEFSATERGRSFLTYVVEQTLAGHADRIKAYTIAVEVFGRSASFDPQNDPIVRMEAGRLRLALEKYYLTGGLHAPFQICIPKGGYVPVFEWRPLSFPQAAETSIDTEAASEAAKVNNRWRRLGELAPILGGLLVILAAVIGIGGYALLSTAKEAELQPNEVNRVVDAPRLLVEQFVDLGTAANSAVVARGLTEEVIGHLARFKEIDVITPPRSAGAASSTDPVPGNARLRLEGSVRTTDEKLRLTVRLVEVSGGQVLWSNIYDEKLDVPKLFELQASLARDVAREIAQPYGAIFRADPQHKPKAPPGDWQAYECTLAYYTYRVELKPDQHGSVQNCLKETTERFPGYATAWALLSLTYSDEIRFKYRLKTDTSQALPKAVSAAEQAIKRDSENVRGMEALLIALFLSGKVDEALAIGARGYAINPNDMEFVGEYGNRLALSGDWTKGCAMMLEARKSSPAPPGNIEVSLAVCDYMTGNFEGAEDWVKVAPIEENPVYHFVAAAIAGQLGRERDAQHARAWIEANAPGMLQDVRREVAMRIVRPEDQLLMLEGLRKAGLTVPEI